MQFEMTLHIDNDVYKADPGELVEIIEGVAGEIEKGASHGFVVEADGKRVGTWRITE